jgi:molecular chaperone GrpE
MMEEPKRPEHTEPAPQKGPAAAAAAPDTEAAADQAEAARVEPAGSAAEAAAAEQAEAEASAPEPPPQSPDEPVTDELQRLRDENAELRDQALRAVAEAENTRRRMSREKEDMTRYAIAGFARDLLVTADNLRRALEAVPEEARRADPVLEAMVDGVAASEKEMLSTFEKHGIAKLDPVGEKFDPHYHQAMFEAEGTGQVPGTVVQVLQPGYVLHGRLLRPAMVAVAKGEAPKKVDTVA